MKKRYVFLWTLVLLVFLITGCGSKSMQEQYSFGKQQLNAGTSSITMELPFTLQKQSENSEMIVYGGNDKHVNIIVTAQKVKADEKSETLAVQLGEHSSRLLVQSPTVKNLKTKKGTVQIAQKTAITVDSEYEETQNGKTTDLAVRQILFGDKDQVWNIMYICRGKDSLGQEVVNYIWGKIQ